MKSQAHSVVGSVPVSTTPVNSAIDTVSVPSQVRPRVTVSGVVTRAAAKATKVSIRHPNAATTGVPPASPLRYIIYRRKSSEEDSKQIQSLETQNRMLCEYAAAQGLTVVDNVAESRSAKDDGNRPIFSSILTRIDSGEASAILAVHLDRLSRNWIEAGQLAKRLELGSLKEIRTPAQTFATTSDLLTMGFFFLLATYMPRDLSIKVKNGIESKLLKGEYPSWAPLGYINNKEDRKIYPDPIRFSYIQSAFQIFASGEYSLK